MSSIKINKEETKRVHVWIKSAIGTPNRRQFKHKNIMYPYFRMYKSPYRARDSRTRQAFWPSTEKYPWHTHQKRWVSKEELNVKFFAEFTNRSPDKKNLFEVCHTLPFHGLNCVFWRPLYSDSYKFTQKNEKTNHHNNIDATEKVNDKDEEQMEVMETKDSTRILRIHNFYYIVPEKVKDQQFFYLKYIRYTMRPFRGKMLGDLYWNHTKIREDISMKGRINGEWNYAFPHISIYKKIANLALNDSLEQEMMNENQRKNIDSISLEELVTADKYTYRPPLPKAYNTS